MVPFKNSWPPTTSALTDFSCFSSILLSHQLSASLCIWVKTTGVEMRDLSIPTYTGKWLQLPGLELLSFSLLKTSHTFMFMQWTWHLSDCISTLLVCVSSIPFIALRLCSSEATVGTWGFTLWSSSFISEARVYQKFLTHPWLQHFLVSSSKSEPCERNCSKG